MPIKGIPFPEPAPHLSEVAQRYFHEQLSQIDRDAVALPAVADHASWGQLNQQQLLAREPVNAQLVARYGASLERKSFGGTPTVVIRPARNEIAGKLLLYIHGGGFVGGAAHDALDSTLPLADQTALRIVSIDYTLAPAADHQVIGDQVLAVLTALYAQHYTPADIGIYGDSAGASIAASAMLRARDRAIPLPCALVLWSPWTDLACTGDTYRTLPHAEPFYSSANDLGTAARCYAGASALDDPRVSVLYADYRGGFPPTLIQCGSREMLFSDSARLHQTMRDAGVAADLEIYDGLWHVFQFKPIDSPEAIDARARTARFFLRHLGISTKAP